MGRRVLGCVFLCCLRDGTSAWGCLRSVALSWEDLGEGEGEVLGLSEQRCEVGIGVGWPLQLGPEPEAKGSGIQMLPSRCEDSACILCGLPHF